MLRNLRVEGELRRDLEGKMRFGAARRADLNITDGRRIKESGRRKVKGVQRKWY